MSRISQPGGQTPEPKCVTIVTVFTGTGALLWVYMYAFLVRVGQCEMFRFLALFTTEWLLGMSIINMSQKGIPQNAD